MIIGKCSNLQSNSKRPTETLREERIITSWCTGPVASVYKSIFTLPLINL